MKYALTLSILAALLAGCAIVPAGYGDHRNGYYEQRDYNRGDGYNRDGNRYYGSDRYYSYRQDAYGGAFQDHGR